jgi:small conductance mechanosensitive channel
MLVVLLATNRPVRPQSPAAGDAPVPASQSKATSSASTQISTAERVLRLEQSIEADTQELAAVRKTLDDPKSEYTLAKEDFERIDKRLKEREKQLTTQPDPSVSLDGIRKVRELAKERFDLAIKENEATQAKYAALDRKIQQDRAALAALKGPALTSQPATVPPAAAPSLQTPTGTPGPEPSAPQAVPGATSQPAAAPGLKIPTLPGITLPIGGTPSQQGSPAADGTTQPTDKQLVKAQEEAQAKEAQAQQAEKQVESISQRIATLRETIKSEHELLETAQKRAKNAQESYDGLRNYIQKLISTGGPQEKVNQAWTRVDDAQKRSSDAEAAVAKQTQRLNELQNELADLQSEHIGALEHAQQKRVAAQQAEKQVETLKNPYSLTKILQWVIIHGPPIVGILVGMGILLYLTRLLETRIVNFISGARTTFAHQPEREARARTLASVFRNVASTAIIVGSTLMVFGEAGLNIVPLLGGAAVIGLAAAFGAQALIKDYFSGFIILLENQYAINDVIKIGETSGVVERITLRMTVLRDVEGKAHYIPHGEITQVTNMTQGWARAVFDIGVAYKEQVDRVMQVLMELGEELCKDPGFRPLILGSPEMLGVDSLGDSAVVIKFLIKTRPLQQWTVKREMLRRIKNRFDELRIELPFPQRTVYLRQETGQDQPGDSDALARLSNLRPDQNP